MLQFRLLDPEPLLYHNEPIWCGGRIVGYIRSGAYGHSLGACIGLGYVDCSNSSDLQELISADYEIEVAGERWQATASVRPMYDPENERIRC